MSKGLHFAVAAGNEDQDACNVSPAGAKNPVTVGASTIADERAYFSNKGECVDVFAPGLNILSTWNQGTRSVNTISGTSMATPHVVGLLAYLLSIYGTKDFQVMDGVSPMRFGPSAERTAATEMQGTAARAFAAAVESIDALLPGVGAAALARFRQATGRTGTPDPGDESWMAWRREQVSHVVRRVFLVVVSIDLKTRWHNQ